MDEVHQRRRLAAAAAHRSHDPTAGGMARSRESGSPWPVASFLISVPRPAADRRRPTRVLDVTCVQSFSSYRRSQRVGLPATSNRNSVVLPPFSTTSAWSDVLVSRSKVNSRPSVTYQYGDHAAYGTGESRSAPANRGSIRSSEFPATLSPRQPNRITSGPLSKNNRAVVRKARRSSRNVHKTSLFFRFPCAPSAARHSERKPSAFGWPRYPVRASLS